MSFHIWARIRRVGEVFFPAAIPTIIMVRRLITWYFLCWWLTYWGWVTRICVNKLTITGSDNGLSPGRRQDIIWTNARILLIWHLGTKFIKIFIEIHISLLKKTHSNGGHFASASMCQPIIYNHCENKTLLTISLWYAVYWVMSSRYPNFVNTMLT